MESSKRIRSRVVRARVIKWDEFHFGVAIDYADDRQLAYSVGTRNQALDEAARKLRQRALHPINKQEIDQRYVERLERLVPLRRLIQSADSRLLRL
jgi:hypothetical protein